MSCTCKLCFCFNELLLLRYLLKVEKKTYLVSVIFLSFSNEPVVSGTRLNCEGRQISDYQNFTLLMTRKTKISTTKRQHFPFLPHGRLIFKVISVDETSLKKIDVHYE